MKYYFEIRVIPCVEIPTPIIISQFMEEVHLKLGQCDGKVAIDFPEYQKKQKLGNTIRLLGKEEESLLFLREAMMKKRNLLNYGIIGELTKVPNDIKSHVQTRRKRVKFFSSYKRLKKRYEEKGTWSSELGDSIWKAYQKGSSYPYVKVWSHSTKKPMMIYIEREPCEKSSQLKFNSYGLSLEDSSIPSF